MYKRIRKFQDLDIFFSPRKKKMTPFIFTKDGEGALYEAFKSKDGYLYHIPLIENKKLRHSSTRWLQCDTKAELLDIIKKDLKKRGFKDTPLSKEATLVSDTINNNLDELNLEQLEDYRGNNEISVLDKRKVERKIRVLKKREDRNKFIKNRKVGDIFYQSYGYDETHTNFFVIDTLTSSKVILKAIDKERVWEDKGKVIPVKGSFKENYEPIVLSNRAIVGDEMIKQGTYEYFHFWSGQPLYDDF